MLSYRLVETTRTNSGALVGQRVNSDATVKR